MIIESDYILDEEVTVIVLNCHERAILYALIRAGIENKSDLVRLTQGYKKDYLDVVIDGFCGV